jgi:AhpD family alkylhydroperoxidase
VVDPKIIGRESVSRRVNLFAKKNGGIDGLVAVETWIAKNFDPRLLELVNVRVSQMNGCAYCLHMHRPDALKQGETDDRLLLLSAWRESRLYADRERVALDWAEALTRIADTLAPDAVYVETRRVFSEELVALSIGVAMINAWNRLAIGFRLQHPADRVSRAA